MTKEEAAYNHIRKVVDAAGHPGWDWVTQDIVDAFIAGAEWQEEQMMDEWLKDRDGCFWDGVNEGKKAMEEQMMKEAAEGEGQAEKDLALTVEDIKTILDIAFWNNDPEKILEEYNRICDTSKVTRR